LEAWKIAETEVLSTAVANLQKLTAATPTSWSKTDVGVEPDWKDDFVAARVLVPSLFDGAKQLVPLKAQLHLF